MKELEAIRRYQTELRSIDAEDDAAFHRAIRDGVALLGLSDEELAHRFNMSRSSVNRWRNGRNAAHPAMRKGIYTWLIRRAGKAISAAQSDDDETEQRTSMLPDVALLAARAAG